MARKVKVLKAVKLKKGAGQIVELKLDLGCGKNKREGFKGVDVIKFDGVDIVVDLRKKWPWADNSVDEAHCSHFLEHLTAQERIHFVNELHRVLKPGSQCTVITPGPFSVRAYGDLTHQWPPVVYFWFYYLKKEWRATQAPHDDIKHNPNGYSCDFEVGWGYNWHPQIAAKNSEMQSFAATFYTEAVQDMMATFKKPLKV